MATAPASEGVGRADEEFLFHLRRGSELLAGGELEPARTSLSRARELRPRDAQVLGLLGQSLYKLGRFEDAVEAYARLVDESPVEAAARVNLGLASLKAKRHAEAVRQLEIALDLNPEHRKAMGYLGLAWLEQGDFERARGWFVRAGSEQMAAKCDELLALAKAAPEPTAAGRGEEPAPHPGPAPGSVSSAGALPDLDAFADARAVPAPGATFAVAGERVTAAVDGELLLRSEGLLSVSGAVRFAPEMKRFRGKPTEKAFGDGAQRMLRAAGEGSVVLRAASGRFEPLRLGDASAYFREEVVTGFEAGVVFENGRLAARPGPDLNLVHLRGPGAVLLRTRGAVASLAVRADAPVRVLLAALVGFSGAVTPRVVPLVADPPAAGDPARGEPLALELSGEGCVLVDEGAAG